MVKLVPILHSSAIDFGRDAARVNKWAGIDGEPLASFPYFGRGLTRRGALTPLGVIAEVVFDAAEAFGERAGYGRGDTAGMPVESGT